MSDMQKVLIPTLQEVMPGAPHRFCVLHLWKNFTKQWKSKELKGIMWQWEKPTTVAEFEGHMTYLKTINCQAWEYLNKWPKEAWTKAHFSTIPNVDNICNNTCEVFNSKILQYRCKLILTMLEEIRCYIMRRWLPIRLNFLETLDYYYKRLEKEIHFPNQWTPIWCGMPCRHAITTISHKGGKPEDMCHEWLSIEAYNKIYHHFIEPAQGPQYWAQVQHAQPIPPHKKVQRGRPKKNRRRSIDEDNVIGHRLKRKLHDFTCGRCGQTHHNIRSCKNIGVPIRPKKYVAPPTSNEDDDLLAQDEQALNEAEEAAAHVQEGPVEINLSQLNLSQDSDMKFMVLATIVPLVAKNKLNITRLKQRKVADKDDAESKKLAEYNSICFPTRQQGNNNLIFPKLELYYVMEKGRTVVVSALQFACTDDVSTNIATAERLIRAAHKQGANIILIQELFEGYYFCQAQRVDFFQRAKPHKDHPTILRMQKLAKELGVVIPVSFFEEANNAHYNSIAIIDSDGTDLGIYRKSHIPDGPGYEEKFYFNPGDTGFKCNIEAFAEQVFQTKFAKIGVAICWDQWFPEAARAMVLQGAEILFYPTAIGSEPHDGSIDSRDHWKRVMQGHAGANLVPLVASNRIGKEIIETEHGKTEITFYGNSFIAGPTGEIVSVADDKEEAVLIAQFDLDKIKSTRHCWGVFRDRRPDLYKVLLTLDGNNPVQ
ncbi:N-carbamoylputrescine amidase [Glycine soja]